MIMVTALVFNKSPPYKPAKPHNSDNRNEITRPVKRPGGKAELVYIAEFGVTGWAFAGLQGQMGIALGAFFCHKAVTARARAMITIGHIASPYSNRLAACEPSMNY
jgi:hypothetical protein